jgi:hypothetical protein
MRASRSSILRTTAYAVVATDLSTGSRTLRTSCMTCPCEIWCRRRPSRRSKELIRNSGRAACAPYVDPLDRPQDIGTISTKEKKCIHEREGHRHQALYELPCLLDRRSWGCSRSLAHGLMTCLNFPVGDTPTRITCISPQHKHQHVGPAPSNAPLCFFVILCQPNTLAIVS